MVTTPIEGALRVRATVAEDPAGDKEVTMEAGRLASLADGSVLVGLGDTRVLVTATASRRVREGADFFPLTVDIEERSYAAGKIPGSFFRREGRSSEAAILTCRLIDRPLRPSFPSSFRNEVHVVGLVLGADQENPYDVLALNGASAALMLSGIPFEGPVGAVRLSYTADGEWLPHPTYAESDAGSFDMVVAGRQLDDGDIAVMMVEAGGTEDAWELYEEGAPKVDEEALAAGLEASKAHISAMIDLQRQLVEVHHETHGTPDAIAWVPQVDFTPEVAASVAAAAGDRIAETAAIGDKAERTAAEAALRDDLVAQVAGAADEADRSTVEKQVKAAFRAATKEAMRNRIVNDGARIDGRGPADLRPLSAEVGIIPTAHGTGLFQRGETQVMNITTLGIGRMDQMIDGIDPVTKKRYMHHYNFPPFSTGEPGFMRGPKRREIGHGALAEKALFPLVPSMSEFPYTIRLVSEVLTSNGSTSMASVCASSLSLMDAGVPLRAPVAGIAMGLVYADGKYTTLTDILGAEDAFGDMDFKVAGTAEFVTALQLDTKIEGIPADVLIGALNQAKDARMAILDVMNAALPEPRPEVNETAPKIISFEIPADKIGEVIGPKGKVINSIQGETGADISVDDDGMVGVVSVSAVDGGAVAEAERQIRLILDPPTPEVNATYTGKVVSITKFGAFINILPGRDGLLHISKIGGGKRIDKVEDVLELGQDLEVYVEDIDPNGKVSLRMAGDTKDSDSKGAGERGGSPKADALRGSAGAPSASSVTDDSDGDTGSDAQGADQQGSDRPQRAPEFAPVLEAKLTETYGDLGPEPAPRNAVGDVAAGAAVADAAARASTPSDAVDPDGTQRRPFLLGRSPLRVIFRVAQVTLLLWAAVVLVERYNATSTEPADAAGQPADLVLGDEVLVDGFDRADGPLGGEDGWDVVTGNWVIADGAAQIVADPGGAFVPALAVSDVPAAERLVIQVTIDSSNDGVGVVYGYEGPDRFNRIGFNPTFAAVGVEQIEGGRAETIGRFGPVGIPDTYEVSLEFARGEMQVWVGNQVVGQVPLGDDGPPRSFGLSSAAGSSATFDDVRVYAGP